MNPIKTAVITILAGMCGSCSTSGTMHSADLLLQFPKTVALSEAETAVSGLLDPQGIIALDSLLLVSEPEADPMISIYGRSGRLVTQFLRKGRGPGETSNLLRTSSYNDTTVQVSVDPESVFLYELQELLQGHLLPHAVYPLPTGSYAFSTILKYGEHDFLYVGKNPGTPAERFCRYHADSDTSDSFGAYPAEDSEVGKLPAEDYSRATAYQGSPILKPDRSKAVVIYLYAVGFDIVDPRRPQVEKSVFYQYPRVEALSIAELKVNVIRRNPESLRGFIDGWCSDKHFYLLYSGKRFSEPNYSAGRYILQYDWEGNPICCYALDREASCFALDKTERCIYAGVSDEAGGSILRYGI